MNRSVPRKRDWAILWMVAVLAAGAAAARAQTAPSPTVTPGQPMQGGQMMQGGHMMNGHEMMQDHMAAAGTGARGAMSPAAAVEQRIADLHRRLGITAAQETQWTAVAQVMRDDAEAVAAVATARQKELATMSAVDNLRSYQHLAQAHADGLNKLADAFASLYATMSDEQKKTADAVFRYQDRRSRGTRQPPAPHQ